MNDDDLIARLRAADPARRLGDLPATWTDDLAEATMSTTRTPGISRASLVAAAAALVLLLGGIFAFIGRDEPAPSAGDAPSASSSATGSSSDDVSDDASNDAGSGDSGETLTLTMPAAAGGRCLPVTAQSLGQAEAAFAATASTVADGTVTLDVDRWFTHLEDQRAVGTVRVRQTDPSMPDLVGAVKFEAGQKYLVAANGGDVMVCGFTGAETPKLTALYEKAFAS